MDGPRTLGVFRIALAAALALAAACSEGDAPADEGGARSAEAAAEARAVAAEGLGGAQPDDDLGQAEPAPSGDDAAEAIERDTYSVRVDAPDATGQGEEGVAHVHVVPKDEWKMNHDFPMRLEVHPPEGVVVEDAVQEIPDAVHYSDERGEWAVRFTPGEGGDVEFEADIRFAVCTDAVCIPKREKLAWTLQVE